MERVFTQEVRRADGKLKFRVGEVRDFGKGTWDQLARNIGRALDSFTALKDAAAQVGAAALGARAARPGALKLARRRVKAAVAHAGG